MRFGECFASTTEFFMHFCAICTQKNPRLLIVRLPHYHALYTPLALCTIFLCRFHITGGSQQSLGQSQNRVEIFQFPELSPSGNSDRMLASVHIPLRINRITWDILYYSHVCLGAIWHPKQYRRRLAAVCAVVRKGNIDRTKWCYMNLKPTNLFVRNTLQCHCSPSPRPRQPFDSKSIEDTIKMRRSAAVPTAGCCINGRHWEEFRQMDTQHVHVFNPWGNAYNPGAAVWRHTNALRLSFDWKGF